MSVRRLIVEVDTKDLNVKEFCREHGVSREFFYDLRRQHKIEGDAALVPRSRAPRRVANRTPPDVEDRIVRARKELADAGLDAGPGSVWSHLDDDESFLDSLPCEATIYRILKRRGLIADEPAKAPKRSRRRFVAERANELWQVDDTGWELADGTPVKILNALDDHSRLLVTSTAMLSATGAATLAVLAGAALVLGWPARFLSDNAKAFRNVLADALSELGIGSTHSRPYHPQTNGKVERFHQTLKKWLAKQPPAATLDELQTQLDIFRHHYNHHRRHRGIGRQRPAEVWADAPKDGPAGRPLGQRSELFAGNVHDGGLRLSHLKIAVGARYNGQAGIAIITGAKCHVFIDGRIARHLTIDPTRHYQRLYNRPGKPTTNPCQQ